MLVDAIRPDAADAADLAERVPDCAVLTAETPKREREAILRGFKNGHPRTVANVGITAIGFDFPALDTVVGTRPTMSLAVYLQGLGRLLRPHPEKQKPWYVDMVGLVQKFGRVEDLEIRENDGLWDIASQDRPLTNVYYGDAGMKCPKCHAPVLYVKHEHRETRAPLCRPSNGIKPNIAIKKEGGKTCYAILGAGAPEATHVSHWAVCLRKR